MTSAYAKFLGVELLASTSVNESQMPTYQLPFRDSLAGNPVLRALHGGVVAGFAEHVALTDSSRLASERAGQSTSVRTINFHIDYLRSAGPRTTYASSEVIRFGRRAALLQVTCWQNDPSKPVARARVHLLIDLSEAGAGQT